MFSTLKVLVSVIIMNITPACFKISLSQSLLVKVMKLNLFYFIENTYFTNKHVFQNATLTLTQRTLQIHGDLNAARMLLPLSAMQLLELKGVHTQPAHCMSVIENARPLDPLGSILQKTGLADMQKYVIRNVLY